MRIKKFVILCMLLAASGVSCKQTRSTENGSNAQATCSGAAGRVSGIEGLLAIVRNNPVKKLEDLPLNRTIPVLKRSEIKSLLDEEKFKSFQMWLGDQSRNINTYGVQTWDQIKAIRDASQKIAQDAKKAWDDLYQGYNTIKSKYPQNFSTPNNVYRGLRLDEGSMRFFLEALNNKTPIGMGPNGTSVWSSASRRPASAKKFADAGKNSGTYSVILVIKQRSGLAVEPIEVIADKEVILPPMARYKVTEAYPMNSKESSEFMLLMEEI